MAKTTSQTKSRTESKWTSDKIQEDVLHSARKVWLAGLGAISMVEEGASDLFDQLVTQGRKASSRGRKELENAKARVEGEWRDARTRVGETLEGVGSKVDQQVAEALHRLGIPTRAEIQALTRRVEQLTRHVDKWQGAAETRTVYHVSTFEDGWKVQLEGADEPMATAATKDEALEAARGLAKDREPSQIVVHKMDGTIQHSYSYGETTN